MDENIISKEKAKEMVLINENGMIHTFLNTGGMLIGGDHSKESVFEDIDKAYVCKKTGEQAQRMHHGLAIIPSKECNQSDILFVETKSV